MQRYLRVLLLALPLSFLIGLWWGHFQIEELQKNTHPKFELRILSQKDSLPMELVEAFKNQYKIRVELIETDDTESFLQLLDSQVYDLVAVKSYHLKPLMENKSIDIMDSEKIENQKNIQADFWPSSEYNWRKAIPYAWGVNGFLGKKGQDFNKAYSELFVQDKANQLFYLSTNFDHLYFLMSQQKPELKAWVQKNKLDLVKDELKTLKSKVTFTHQTLKPLEIGFQQTTNGKASFFIKQNSDYDFYIPSSGTLFWMNFMSITVTGNSNPESYRFINYLISTKIQQEELLKQELASVSVIKDLELQSASFIRKIPLPKLIFPLEINDPKSSWESSIKLILPEIINQHLAQ
ncbi:MAG: hypothetical protein KDD58_06260 [Bdellovibrionales bacterium]|nr:hypothetical protein [Bdellovibrionales bacterium]